jgi:hypothetical protein
MGAGAEQAAGGRREISHLGRVHVLAAPGQEALEHSLLGRSRAEHVPDAGDPHVAVQRKLRRWFLGDATSLFRGAPAAFGTA